MYNKWPISGKSTVYNITMYNTSTVDAGYQGRKLNLDMWVVFGLLVAVGMWILFSNSLIIWVIARTPSLHARTYWLLTSLACSDLVAGLGTPTSWFLQEAEPFPPGNPICVSYFLFIVFPMLVSRLHGVLLTLDRFITLTRPLDEDTFLSGPRWKVAVLLVWVYCALVGLLLFMWNSGEGSDSCNDRIFPNIYVWVFFVGTAYLADILIAIMYLKIYLLARSQAKKIDQMTAAFGQKSTTSGKAGKSVFLTVASFIICWDPFVTTFLLRTFDVDVGIFLDLSFLLAFANSGMNFIIYVMKNKTFSRALRQRLGFTNKTDIQEFSTGEN